jgi:hypothetical protein
MSEIPLSSRWAVSTAVVLLNLLMIFAIGGTVVSEAQGEGIIIDSDTGPLIPGLQSILAGPAGTTGQQPAQPGVPGLPPGEVAFRVISVKNIDGNNPLNPTQPVLNFAGQTVSSVDELVQLIQDCQSGGPCKAGGGGGGQGSKQCSPSSVTNLDPAFGPASVGFFINPNSSVCAVSHFPGPPLTEEAFYAYPRYCMAPDPTGSRIDVAADPGYSIAGLGSGLLPGSYTFTLVKGTKRWTVYIDLRIETTAPLTCMVPTMVKIWRITVNGITPLN